MSDTTVEQTLREVIGELAGFASVAWDKDGVFLSDLVIQELEKVMARVESALAEANQHGYQRGRHDAAADIIAVPRVTTWELDDGSASSDGRSKPATRISLVDQAKAVAAAQGRM